MMPDSQINAVYWTIYVEGLPPGEPCAELEEDGWRFRLGEKEVEVTVNSRKELMAAIEAVESLPAGARATAMSDSYYLIYGANQWLEHAPGNRRRERMLRPEVHWDLWARLDRALKSRDVEWVEASRSRYDHETARLTLDARASNVFACI